MDDHRKNTDDHYHSMLLAKEGLLEANGLSVFLMGLARISHQRGVHGAETRGTSKKDNPLPAMTEPPHAHRLYLDATGV